VAAGAVKFVGAEKDHAVREAERPPDDEAEYAHWPASNPYWDGRVSERIRQAIEAYIADAPRFTVR